MVDEILHMSLPYSENQKKNNYNISVQYSQANFPDANTLSMRDNSFNNQNLGRDASFSITNLLT